MDRPSNDEIYEKYHRLASRLAQPYCESNRHLRTDIVQEAKAALLVAADKFDWASVEDYYGFSSYLERVIKSHVRKMIANIGFSTSGASDWALRGDKNDLHLSGSLARYEWKQGQTYAGGAVWGDDGTDDELFRMLVGVAAEVLTDHQLLIFEMYYVDGITSDAQIAEKLDLQPESVKKVRSRALKRVRQRVLDTDQDY